MSTTWVRSAQTLLAYGLGRRLGRGGFGEVFRARIAENGRNVAVKKFLAGNRSPDDVLRAWRAEWWTHASLNHPHVIEVLDAFSYGGDVYIVTELASGTLEDDVEFGLSWTEYDVVRAGLQLSSALHYIHEHARPNSPLVHRDVTTKNVFYFEDEDTFKLGDFGIAKLLGDPSGVATTQVANWGFVAPELVKLKYTTPQSDLYQLGLVLYAMLAGQHAVDQTLSRGEKIQAIKDGVPHQQALSLACDLALKKVILKLLMRQSNRRYSTSAELFAALQPIRLRLRNP